MDDLIRRQDAINSIESHIRTGDELYPITETDKILNHAFEISASCIYNMSSAEPIIRCKDCKHRIVNEHYGEKGYMDLKAMCDLDTDDIFQLGRNAENDDWFCADGERKADG